MFSFDFQIPHFSVIFGVFYTLALVCAARAILSSRTPQGATAWVVGLLGFPLLSVPLFLLFGRSRFHGYTKAWLELDKKLGEQMGLFRRSLAKWETGAPFMHGLLAPDAQVGFTRGNKIELLVNADQAYPRMLDDLRRARHSILFQFYIFRSDATAQEFVSLLIERARSGVQVSFLYDEIGCKISESLIRKMKLAGIEVETFNTRRGIGNRLQINFRNHRKIIAIDGKVAYVGGLNIGDEYLGKLKKFGSWRDTHVRLQGPSVIAAQIAFAKDWFWATEQLPEAQWEIQKSSETDHEVMVLHTGPTGENKLASLNLLALIQAATKRIWIANAYFVPPESLMDALILASAKGVEVRLLVPDRSDNQVVRLASEVAQETLLRTKVKVYKYTRGFMHQKVLLIDDQLAMVGSTNLDFRSMFINFEISAQSLAPEFVSDVEKMLRRDYESSFELPADYFQKYGVLKRLIRRAAHLLAPIL